VKANTVKHFISSFELGVIEFNSLGFSDLELGASSLNSNFHLENLKLLHSITPNSKLVIEQFKFYSKKSLFARLILNLALKSSFH